MFYGSATSPESAAAAAALLHQECVGRAEAALAARAPRLPPEWRRLYAVLNVDVIKALLPLAESGDEAHRARVLAEVKRLLLAYMTQALAGAG